MIEAGVTIEADTSALDALIDGFEERVAGIVARYADLIAEEARRLAPVDTGELRASIAVRLDGLAAAVTAGEGLPDTRAIVQEFGSSRQAAQPYLRPAFDRYIPAFLDELAALFG